MIEEQSSQLSPAKTLRMLRLNASSPTLQLHLKLLIVAMHPLSRSQPKPPHANILACTLLSQPAMMLLPAVFLRGYMEIAQEHLHDLLHCCMVEGAEGRQLNL